MENENHNSKQKQELEVSDILRKSVRVYLRNPNFIIFTFLTSLPLFCIMVYFEIYLQEILVETCNILNLSYGHLTRYDSCLDLINRFNKDYLLKLIFVGFIYMVPLYVSEFVSAAVTVDLASKLHSREKKMTLKEMFETPFHLSRLRASFVTSIYVLFLTTTHQLGLLWIVLNYHVFLKDISFYVLLAVICSIAFAKVLRIYLEGSAMWNMSLVISVLEGIYGVDALAVSAYFSSGNRRRGLFLMLIFFAWGHLVRLSCYLIGRYEQGNAIFVQVGLSCMVNPLKWVVCMIYFHDCKERKLEKKTDEESGKDVKNGS
ncbi:hypothetical protein LR48_Vigan511s010700 [Vigna angularis]|uniref:Uncharacterized protein n=2 Tax=Phaseolus angularis TaxID=3914 RepID=A0A0L9TDP4_PHAAN|nr:uncharacterized protein LOC108321466 [Vigna angularis]KOM28284.1 hypothetical protein LR48_Vigan511s010700 [Vigna angularis]BAT74661.1 hypothetical protein VIGAN_01237400 [Vigna angularis var. angularis]